MRPPRSLRLLWRQTQANLLLTLEYRVGFFIMMTNAVLGPAIALLVWLAVGEVGVQLPFDQGQFVSYFVLMTLVSLVTSTWAAEYVATDIRLGELNKVLLWPAPHVSHYLANNLGEKVIKLGLLLPAAVVLIVAFRADLHLPAAPSRWLLFVVALLPAAALRFLLDYLLGSLAFWLHDVGGLLRLERLLYGLLAGRFIPLAFFPVDLAGLLEVQPFRYLLSFPLEVLTVELAPAALARGFACQAGYLLVCLLAYRLIWHYGPRAYGATGA